jgi:hypothetical protein
MSEAGQMPPENEALLITATDALRSIRDQPPESIKINRVQAEAIWRAIAADLMPDTEVSNWCRLVAKRIVSKVLGFDSTETRKSDQAVLAIFLPGRAPTALAPDEAQDLALLRLATALEHLSKRRRGNISPYDVAKRMKSRGHFKSKSLGAAAEIVRREMQRR